VTAVLDSAGACAVATWRGYRAAPLPTRAIQSLRPFICPFETLLDVVPTGSRVLDVGCGSGLFLGLLCASGRLSSATGFDSSASAIAAARRMAGEIDRHGVLEFRALDATAQWPGGEFDVVSIIDVMHHVPKAARGRVLETAVSRIAPGGLLLYKDMVDAPAWRVWGNRLHDLVMAGERILEEPIENVTAALDALGMGLERLERYDRYWYGHELAVFRRPASGGDPGTAPCSG